MTIKLLHIWSSILETNNLLEDDHFFEVGGHSLLALQLLANIEKEFKISIELSELFQYPTIRKLEQLIKLKIEHAQVSQEAIKNTMVILNQQGDGLPIILIHPIGGTVFCYYPLSQALGKSRPIYAIEDPGIYSKCIPFDSIESIADAYLKLIKEKQPKGPYLIGGASLGGLIAYQIAVILKNKWQEDSAVFLIDTWAKPSEKMNDPERLKQAMLRQYHLMKDKLKSVDIPNPMAWLSLYQQRIELINYFKLSTLESPVYLYKAKMLMPDIQDLDDKNNYWSNYAANLSTVLIPGNHETILLPENAKQIADKINLAIDNINDNLTVN